MSNEVNAFPFTATTSGRAGCARIYLATANASPVRVGVYSDNAGQPSDRIAIGTVLAPAVGWNQAVLDVGVRVSAQVRLWLAVVPAAEEVELKVRTGCTGRRRQLTGELTAKFTPEEEDSVYCDAAFYLSP